MFLDIMLLLTWLQYKVDYSVTFTHTGKPKNLCDLLSAVVWNQTCTISKVRLYINKKNPVLMLFM